MNRRLRTSRFRRCSGFEVLERRCVLAASLQVAMTANSSPADVAPGLLVDVGQTIDWVYTVKNTGTVPLSNVSVVDDSSTPGNTSDDVSIRPITTNPVAFGTVEKKFIGLIAARFAQHPTLPYLYASIPATNSIAIINTQTLVLEDNVFIGSNPQGLALSSDGSRLYVANFSSNFVGVLDTTTRTALPSLQMTETPRDIEVGADGRLFVLGTSKVFQIDPVTGATVGPSFSGDYQGEIAINPEKTRFYYANYGISPATLNQYDITGPTPVLLKKATQVSGNGQDLALSNDGSFVSLAMGGGQTWGYQIAKYRTSDMVILGAFNTGAYPTEIVFSPDDAVAYTGHSAGEVQAWNTTTFQQTGVISTPSEDARELFVDRSGAHLFGAYPNDLRVFSTGRVGLTNIGDTNGNLVLDPGETWSFKRTSSAVTGSHTHTVLATARDTAASLISHQDVAHYFAAPWQASLSITANGASATTNPGVGIVPGSTIVWQYAVTNSGQNALTGVLISDDNGTPANAADDLHPTYVSGDSDGDNVLDIGESWLFTASGTAASGNRQQVARVLATPIDGAGLPLTAQPASYSKTAYYFGAQTQVVVQAAINNSDADVPSGPVVDAGSTLQLNYSVTNIGNVPITQFSLSDDRGTSLSGDDLAPNSGSSLARGTLIKTFSNYTVSGFVQHPTLPIVYAAVTSQNSIAIINTNTLEVELVPIGSAPLGVALSNDASRLYVANSTSHFIGVLDTVTRTALAPIQVAQRPRDIEVGADGRLFVVGESSLLQINPETGASVGPNVTGVYFGEVEINREKTLLYYTNYSTTRLEQFDLTTNPPTKLKSVNDGASNGQDMHLSPDGSFITFIAAVGQGGHGLAKYRTSDMAILGKFDSGGVRVTIAPDGAIVYIGGYDTVNIFNTTTFLSLGNIPLTGSTMYIEPNSLFVDRSNAHLFVSVDGQLRVYSTGFGASVASGDSNANGALDPGETWQFTATTTAAAGQQQHVATFQGLDAFGNPVLAAPESSHYYGTTELQVVQSPGQTPVTPVVLPPGATFTTVSDSRFEVVGGMLRVKAAASFSTVSDVNKYLTVQANDGTILQKFKLKVLAGAAPWQNAAKPTDVDGSNVVEPYDALLIINDLNALGPRSLSVRIGSGVLDKLDVDGDGFLAPVDALLVIILLNSGGGGEAPVAADTSVVETTGLDLSQASAFDTSEATESAESTVYPALLSTSVPLPVFSLPADEIEEVHGWMLPLAVAPDRFQPIQLAPAAASAFTDDDSAEFDPDDEWESLIEDLAASINFIN